MVELLIKGLSVFAAIICIVLGLLTVWTPIPTGVPLLALGAVLLIASSRRFAKFVRRHRKNFVWLNQALHWIEVRSSGRFKKIIRRTRPRYFKKRLGKGQSSPKDNGTKSAA
ncbi:hypothetical protein [Pseudovibrio denitrificans]|uniref:hypothetical protein n=1 Tax=Pseudovibrio denitrificans TaxID=258256 RepID=UPI001ABF9CE1|nr:hypothetical protein [Pseudovibrio denitrificans]